METYLNRPFSKSWSILLIAIGTLLLFTLTILALLSKSGSMEWSLLHFNEGKNSSNQLENEILASGYDGGSCRSRHDRLLHRPLATAKPSAYLISKLKRYENLHKICGPDTHLYNMTKDASKSSMSSVVPACKYAIWLPIYGLGNRITSLISTFLYALLTDRVLLIQDQGIYSLFCEPFPKSSWLLPSDFPLFDKLGSFHSGSDECFGQLLRNNLLGNSSASLPHPYVFLHLDSQYDYFDQRFYCDKEHSYVQDVPWLIFRTDLYFAPSLFSMMPFEEKLLKLFPDKELVFHLLARYLLNPEDSVWGLIRRFYETYLSDADFKLGIQIRNNTFHGIPFEDVLNVILSCTTSEGLLPSVYQQESGNLTKPISKRRKIGVLLTSLTRNYFEKMRKMYWMQATVTGETVAIHQPSFEEFQDTGNLTHDQKALAEMYLLSLSDELVTSPSSTFGYVAQGLGGLTPRMIVVSKNKTGQQPPCPRVQSMEPCNHVPPYYDCEATSPKVKNTTATHTRLCLDAIWGGHQLVNDAP